jgi:hypothetical protein
MSFIYLATPYSTNDKALLEERVDIACKYAAQLMAEGYTVFAPIPHSHFISLHLEPERQLDHEFWMRQDLSVLRHCEALVVLMLPGWEESRGVQREIQVARACGIDVHYVPLHNMELTLERATADA